MQTSVIDPKSTYTYEENGMLITICIHSGKTLSVRQQYDEGDPPEFIEHQTPDGTPVFLGKGVPLNESMYTNKKWAFSQATADIICTKLANGGRITPICKEPGMPPYAIVRKWVSEYQKFRQAYEQACRDRADNLADEALDMADTAVKNMDKEFTPAAKLKIDTLKWAASVGDPERYGTKTKLLGEGGGAIQLIVNTGILRPGDPGYTEPKDVTPLKPELETEPNPRSGDESEKDQGKVPEESSGESDDKLLDVDGV